LVGRRHAKRVPSTAFFERFTSLEPDSNAPPPIKFFRLSLFCWGVLVVVGVLESSPDFGWRAENLRSRTSTSGLWLGERISCRQLLLVDSGPEPLRVVGHSIIALHAWARHHLRPGQPNTLRGGHQPFREEWARNGDTYSPSLHFAKHFHKWESWRPTTWMDLEASNE
jgi:hypothetical protein